MDLLVEDLLKVLVVAWKEMFGSLSEYDDTAELQALATPVLLVWGDADPIVPRAMQDQLLQAPAPFRAGGVPRCGSRPALGNNPTAWPPLCRRSLLERLPMGRSSRPRPYPG